MNHADLDCLEGSPQSARRRINLGSTMPGQSAIVDAPNQATRWMVLAHPERVTPQDAALYAWMQMHAHQQGMATLTLEGAQLSVYEQSERLRRAVDWLREQDSVARPVHMMVGGRALAAALRSDIPGITSLLALNGRPGMLWRKPRALTPTTFLLSPNASRRMLMANRLARLRLGKSANLMYIADRDIATERMAAWLRQPSVRVPVPRRHSGQLARRVAGGAAALAVSIPLVIQPGAAGASVPRPTHVQSAVSDPFADGITLGASAMRGDGLMQARPAKVKRAAAGGTILKASNIHGDGIHPRLMATGSQALIDSSGVKWFANTNITFSTTSSASGAMSEASFTHSVAASTLNGGTVASTLNDAFDGYNTMCLSVNGSFANCATGDPNVEIYNKNGAAALDTSCQVAATPRQILYPNQTMLSGALEVSRKVYVPADDAFARWTNTFTNTSTAPVTVTMVVANNLGSDSNTRVVTTASGDASATTDDAWVTSFQNFSGTTSSDPRIAHVLRGDHSTALTGVNFVDGDDNPYWSYQFVLQPGEVGIILNLASVQPSKAAAAAKAAELSASPDKIFACMTREERGSVLNFSGLFTQSLPQIAIPGDPDLVVTSVTLDPNKTSYAPGEPVRMSVTITNQGSGRANPFWVDLYLNPAAAPTVNTPWNENCGLTPCYGIAWGVAAGLEPGQSIVLTSTVDSYVAAQTIWPGYFANGTTQVVVLADSYNPGSATGAVTESNEANNSASVTIGAPVPASVSPNSVPKDVQLPQRPTLSK